MDDFEEIVQLAIKEYANLMWFGDMLYTIDYDGIYKRYAEELGKDELTDLEFKQALMNAVLGQADG